MHCSRIRVQKNAHNNNSDNTAAKVSHGILTACDLAIMGQEK